MKNTVETEPQRERILSIAARHGASNVRIFGSRARGTEEEGSDLDLLVSMDAGRTLLDLVELTQELTDTLKVEVDVVTERELNPVVRDEVEKEAVRL